MIITFFGHSNFIANKLLEQKLLNTLDQLVGNSKVDFYLGCYGGFDSLALSCCSKYKAVHPQAKLIFVTPYLDPQYSKLRSANEGRIFDEIIYPDIEASPHKYSISYRNRWMVKNSDVVVTYVTHSYGGAYAAYIHARNIGKTIVDLTQH